MITVFRFNRILILLKVMKIMLTKCQSTMIEIFKISKSI